MNSMKRLDQRASDSIRFTSGPAPAIARRFAKVRWPEILLSLLLLSNFAGRADIFWEGFTTANDFTSSTGDLVNQVFLFALFATSVSLARRWKVNPGALWWALSPAMPLLVWALISFEWSHVPDVTLRRSLRLAVEFLIIAILVLEISQPWRVLRAVAFACVATVLLDIAAAASIPATFTPIGFAGVHGTKNGTGAFYFIEIATSFYAISDERMLRSKPLAYIGLLMGIVFMVLSECKTVMTTMAFASAVTLLVRWIPRIRRNQQDVVALGGLVLLFVGLLVFQSVGFRNWAMLAFNNPSLTGRTDIWTFVIGQWSRNPAIGIGYGALWQSGEWITDWLARSRVSWLINEAHNGYLDILAQLGVVGFSFLVIFLLRTTARVYRLAAVVVSADMSRMFNLIVYVLSSALVYDLSESSLFRANTAMWFALIIVSTLTAKLLYDRRSSLRPAETQLPFAPTQPRFIKAPQQNDQMV